MGTTRNKSIKKICILNREYFYVKVLDLQTREQTIFGFKHCNSTRLSHLINIQQPY